MQDLIQLARSAIKPACIFQLYEANRRNACRPSRARSPWQRTWALTLVVIQSFTLGCGSKRESAAPGKVTLTLGWVFADGRSCADSGVERVHLSIDGETGHHSQDFACYRGFAMAALPFSVSATPAATVRTTGRATKKNRSG